MNATDYQWEPTDTDLGATLPYLDLPHQLDLDRNMEHKDTSAGKMKVPVVSSTSSASRNSKITCFWGVCKSDTRYPDRSPPATYFIPFPKPGKTTTGMTVQERDK